VEFVTRRPETMLAMGEDTLRTQFDGTDSEPLPLTSVLYELPNVVTTPQA
jgi:phosphoglycerate dehydrogenase-like enzyme